MGCISLSTAMPCIAGTLWTRFGFSGTCALLFRHWAGEVRDTLEDVVEPYLLQIGFLRRTKRGREITKQACKHLNLKYHKKENATDQPELFEQSNQSPERK